jgi:hypothetical protein
MALWKDFTTQVDSRIAKLPPEAQAAVTSFATNAPRMNGVNGVTATPENNAAYSAAWGAGKDALLDAGYSDAEAEMLLDAAWNVRKKANAGVGEMAFNGDQAWGNYNADEIEAFLRGSDMGGGGADKDPISANIRKFLASLDPNSAQTQAAYARADRLGKTRQNQMSSAAGMGSMGSGNLAGGLSAMGQAGIQGDLKAKYDLQRGSLQQAGLGLLSNRDLGLKGLEQGYVQMQNQQAEQAWAAKQNQAQGIGSTIGGIGGTLAGAYFNMPGLGKMGSELGGSVGGMAAGGGGGPRYAKTPSFGGSNSSGGTGY